MRREYVQRLRQEADAYASERLDDTAQGGELQESDVLTTLSKWGFTKNERERRFWPPGEGRHWEFVDTLGSIQEGYIWALNFTKDTEQTVVFRLIAIWFRQERKLRYREAPFTTMRIKQGAGGEGIERGLEMR